MYVRFDKLETFDMETYDSPETKELLISHLKKNHLKGLYGFCDGMITRKTVEDIITIYQMYLDGKSIDATDIFRNAVNPSIKS